METLQNFLTVAIEVIAIAGLTGIFAHAIWTQHCRFMTDYCPVVTPFQKDAIATQPELKPEVEVIAIKQPEAKQESDVVSKVIPSVESVKTVKKPGKTRSQMEAPQVKLQPMLVRSAAIDYTNLTSEQFRKERDRYLPVLPINLELSDTYLENPSFDLEYGQEASLPYFSEHSRMDKSYQL
jgi:hypothetical protein